MSEREISRRSFLRGAAASAAGAAAASAFGSGPVGASPPGSDLTSLGVAQAAALIRTRRVSPVELVDASLARIEQVEPLVSAFITVAADHARAAAMTAEREIMRGNYRGPLHGIPYGVKDTHYTAGILTTARTGYLANFVPDWNATVVCKLNNAGAILVGKTNLPEYSFGTPTGVPLGTNNPWDLTRSPGVSSAGSAAALAARMLPMTTGGDTSASIRGPAGSCGVVGLKPTYGRVSRYGVAAISWSLDYVGPMTRSVEDNALMLNVMAGYDPNDWSTANVPVPDYTRTLNRSVRGMKIAVVERRLLANHHLDVLAAFDDALEVFRGMGAELTEVVMPPSYRIVIQAHQLIRIIEAAAYHRPFLTEAPESYFEAGTVRRDVEAASLLPAMAYQRALQLRSIYVSELTEALQGFDAYLTPNSGAASGVGAPGATNLQPEFNLNGFPAMAVPMGFSTTPPGLPLALQIVGKPFEEEIMFAIGHAYQRVTDWHTRSQSL